MLRFLILFFSLTFSPILFGMQNDVTSRVTEALRTLKEKKLKLKQFKEEAAQQKVKYQQEFYDRLLKMKNAALALTIAKEKVDNATIDKHDDCCGQLDYAKKRLTRTKKDFNCLGLEIGRLQKERNEEMRWLKMAYSVAYRRHKLFESLQKRPIK